MCYRHLPASAFPLQHIPGMNLCDFLYTASFCSSSVIFFTVLITFIYYNTESGKCDAIPELSLLFTPFTAT